VSLLKRARPVAGERVLSAVVARQVRAMLETVVAPGGTAPAAQVAAYRVAGKTGTVKKYIGGGYAEGRYRALFAGMIPASAPRLVMVVMIDDPKGKRYYGGQVAAPVFARVMKEAVRLLDIPPDRLPRERLQLAGHDGGSA